MRDTVEYRDTWSTPAPPFWTDKRHVRRLIAAERWRRRAERRYLALPDDATRALRTARALALVKADRLVKGLVES